MTSFGVPVVGQVAQPLRVFLKARVQKCAPVGMHFCTPAVRRMGWGRRFEDGITVGWEGRRVERVAEWVEVWWDGFWGSGGWCGGCGYEARTLGAERVVAGERGLSMLSGRIRAEIGGRLCYHPSVYQWLCLQI